MSDDYTDLLERLKLTVESGLGPASVRAAQAIDAITALKKRLHDVTAFMEEPISEGREGLISRLGTLEERLSDEYEDDSADVNEAIEVIKEQAVKLFITGLVVSNEESRAESAEAQVAALREALELIAIVNQGCGGNLTPMEMVESAMRQARKALEASR